MSVLDGFRATYAVPVLLGLMLLVAFPGPRVARAPAERRTYAVLQGATLVGAVVGAKLAGAFGDHGWPVSPLPPGMTWLAAPRSITGGLVGGLLAAEVLKPVVGWQHPPNDHFAARVPFAIAIGRVGCWLSGCCLGRESDALWAVLDASGHARHPIALFELVFQLGAGVALVALWRRGVWPGRLFATYLVAYGMFRFAVEPLRVTPVFAAGLTGYQLVCVLMVVLGAASWWSRRAPFGEEPCT